MAIKSEVQLNQQHKTHKNYVTKQKLEKITYNEHKELKQELVSSSSKHTKFERPATNPELVKKIKRRRKTINRATTNRIIFGF